MIEGFRASLTQINRLMWVFLSLAFVVILLDPGAESISFLGTTVNRAQLSTVIPGAFVVILLLRQVLILNASQIVKANRSHPELKDIVTSHPLVEFMRWKFDSFFGMLILTGFQIVVDFAPAISIGRFYQSFGSQEIAHHQWMIIAVLVLLGIWNYSSLRYDVYQPLAGKIKTED